MIEKLCTVRDHITKQKPLIHCLTNPISINQCANLILSVGAKPIMAEHPKEVCEITATADALMLNMGNITDARLKSMKLSVKKAKKKEIPILADVVGISCSKLRRTFVKNMFKNYLPSVIKGNYSEILSLYNEKYFSSGVDADETLKLSYLTEISVKLSKKYKTVIIATGQTDIIADGKKIIYVKNGTSKLSDVTGTGCMLGALCTAFLTVLSPLDAAVSACIYLGICGELAKTEDGNGSFMLKLMDNISKLKKEEILKYINVEEIE